MSHALNPEDEIPEEIQAEKYRSLRCKIAIAKVRGQPFILRGAKEISLYIRCTELEFRSVFLMDRIPIHHEGTAALCLDVDAYDAYVQLQRYCRIHGLEFEKEARRRRLFEPELQTAIETLNKLEQFCRVHGLEFEKEARRRGLLPLRPDNDNGSDNE